jgi:hypothetical protein
MATNSVSPKKGKVVDIPANAPTIGTPTAGASQVSVAFTEPSTSTGGPIYKYQAISSPGSFTGTGTTSPVIVTGLTNGTSYTFTVAAGNATGYGPYSSASESAAPVDPAGFASIATVSLSSGNQSSISFTSIPSTYKHLQIRAIYKWNYDSNPTSNDQSSVGIRFNSDSGSNYTLHYLTTNGSSVSSGASVPTSKGYTGISVAPNGYSSFANMYGAAVVDILDYTNTNKYTTIRTLAGSDRNGTGFINLTSSLWLNTAAITNIEILPDYPSWKQYSHFALYGIKG